MICPYFYFSHFFFHRRYIRPYLDLRTVVINIFLLYYYYYYNVYFYYRHHFFNIYLIAWHNLALRHSYSFSRHISVWFTILKEKFNHCICLSFATAVAIYGFGLGTVSFSGKMALCQECICNNNEILDRCDSIDFRWTRT